MNPLQRLVMVSGRIGRERVEAPAAQQPGTHLGVRDSHLDLPLEEEIRLVPGGLEHFPVLIGEVDPEDHPSHIVKDSGEKREFGGLVGCFFGKTPGQHGTEQGMMPVKLHVEKGPAVDPGEDLVDGGADGDAAHSVAPQLEKGVIHPDDLLRPAVEGGIDDPQDPRRECGIPADDLRDVPDGHLLVAAGLDELEEHLGERREIPRRLDARQEVRRPVIHGCSFCIHMATHGHQSNFCAVPPDLRSKKKLRS